MNILLTGASGLIGKALLKQLVADGHKITALSRSPNKAKDSIKKQYGAKLLESVSWIETLDGLTNLDKYEAVINLAGEPIVAKRWSDAQKKRIENSRWLMTKQLTDLIKKSQTPPRIFISGSAIGFYGRQGSDAVEEDHQHVFAEFSHHLCKRWEDIALDASSEKTRVCLLRTGIVLSDKGGALEKMLMPFKMGLGGPIGDGNHYMSWIHIEDMVRGINFLLHCDDCSGPYNFTAPNPVDNKTFSSSLASALKRPAFLPMPKIALKILLGEMADLLIYGQNVIPARLQHAGFEFSYRDINNAFKALRL